MDILSVFRKSPIPAGDKDTLTLCKRVEPNYKAYSKEISSFSKTTFSDLIVAYENVLNEMYVQRVDRNPTVKKIELAKKKHYEAVGVVKSYLIEEHGTTAAPHYYFEFGMEPSSRGVNLPNAQEAHAASLVKMKGAVIKHGFGNKKYGAEFWENCIAEFNMLIAVNNISTGNISGLSARKNEIKSLLQVGLKQIRKMIESESPTTYKKELRNFGFLNERN